jgi:hypothetical protein
MSSDVEPALRHQQVVLSGALRGALDDPTRFNFSTPAAHEESYRHCVRLGNGLMSEVDQEQLLDSVWRVISPSSMPASFP